MSTPFVMRLLCRCPGGLGMLLRQKLYPRCFKACGRKVIFGYGVQVLHPDKITVGAGVCFSDFSLVDGGVGQGLDLGAKLFIGVGSNLVCHQGSMRVGEGSNIGSFCRLEAHGEVVLERDTLLAAFCEVGGTQQGPARLDAGVWLGVRVEVPAGVTIGRDAIVGTHAQVQNNIPDWAIAVGRPAEVKRLRSTP